MTDNEPLILNLEGGFKNNPRLKKVGTQIQWTKESIEEYQKCAKDPVYFIENYMKIIHVDRGLVPFKLRGYQVEMIDAIHANRRVIMCMARQSGKSTAMIGYILWYILFNESVTAALVANKEKTALEILSKLHLAFMYIPHFLQQGIVEWSKHGIVLENGSRAIADSTASDTIRGYTVNLLIIDEAAHVENWEEFASSVIPTISSGRTTKLVQISTPLGLNHFYKTWQNAQPTAKESNGYIPIMVHWSQVPGRDNEWKLMAVAELNNDYDKFAQEYECEFLGSSGTLIAGWKLKEMMVDYQEPIYYKDGLSKYVEPMKNHSYAVTVDVSEGKGLNYSVLQCIDITTMPWEQVCVFRSNLMGPHEFAQIIHQTAKSYNSAMILVEYENLGPQVSDILFNDFGYENLLSTASQGAKGKQITMAAGRGVDRGVKMTQIVRSMGCSLIKLLIEQNKLKVIDYNSVHEFATFSREEGKKKFEAEEGCHDDLVMALVVFGWMSDQQYFTDLINVNTLSELRDKDMQAVEEDLIPFGFIDKGEPDMVELAKQWDDLMIRGKSWILMDESDPDYPLDF